MSSPRAFGPTPFLWKGVVSRLKALLQFSLNRDRGLDGGMALVAHQLDVIKAEVEEGLYIRVQSDLRRRVGLARELGAGLGD